MAGQGKSEDQQGEQLGSVLDSLEEDFFGETLLPRGEVWFKPLSRDLGSLDY
jgi:hypothetical protein